MDSKAAMWIVITILSTFFYWIGSVMFGGGIFGVWNNILGTMGAFLGLWIWFKFMRNA